MMVFDRTCPLDLVQNWAVPSSHKATVYNVAFSVISKSGKARTWVASGSSYVTSASLA